MMDYYKLKGKTKRIELKLLSQINNPIPAIDLTLILKKLYSLYYKTDLIESLAIRLSTGVNPSNFLISQKTITDSSILKDKDTLDYIDNSDIFYKHSFFYALFPTKSIISVDISSKCFRDINNLLYNFDCKTIYLRKLKEFVPYSYSGNFSSGMEYLYKLTKELSKAKYEHQEYINNGVDSIIGIANNKFNAYKADEKRLSELSDLIDENNDKEFKNNDVELLKRYIDPFFYSFITNDFPVLYQMDANDLNVLCHYHFNKNSFNNPFYFDLKSVTHNSPVSIIIEAAQTIITPLLLAYLAFLGHQKTYFESKKAQLETKDLREKRSDAKDSEKHLEQINILIANYSLNEKIFEENFLNTIERIPHLYYKKRLLETLNSLVSQYEFLLKDFSLVISENRIIK